MPQLNRIVADDTLDFPTIRFDHRLPSMIETPAIVLYHFNAGDDPEHSTGTSKPPLSGSPARAAVSPSFSATARR